MADRHLHVHPKPLVRPYGGTEREAWWYEDAEGLTIVVEHRKEDGGQWLRTEQYRIPWSMVRGALKRKDRLEERQKASVHSTGTPES